MPNNLTALRARIAGMLETEGRATQGDWTASDDHLYRGSEGGRHAYREIGSTTKAIWVARFQAFTDDPGEYEANRQLAVAARNSFRPLLTLALELIDACEACGTCSDPQSGWLPEDCISCTPSRTLLKRLAEEIGE